MVVNNPLIMGYSWISMMFSWGNNNRVSKHHFFSGKPTSPDTKYTIIRPKNLLPSSVALLIVLIVLLGLAIRWLQKVESITPNYGVIYHGKIRKRSP